MNQKFDGKPYEIIISDGMSTDGTLKIIEGFEKNNKNIKIINNPDETVPSGFNRALSISLGELIIRVDGHVELDKDFIKNYFNNIENIDSDCVGGITIHRGIGIIGNSISIAQSSKFGVGGAIFRENAKIGRYVDTLAFGVYKRKVFQKFGGYDEELVKNQDDEFNFRINREGKNIWLDPSMKSYYINRNTFFKLFKQYFFYGFYKVRVIQKRKGIASWRHLVPLVFCLSLITGIILLKIKNESIYLNSILLVYLASNFMATLYLFLINPRNLLPIIFLPISFTILHISYGMGFLSGLIFFLNKWKDIKLKNPSFDKGKFIFNS